MSDPRMMVPGALLRYGEHAVRHSDIFEAGDTLTVIAVEGKHLRCVRNSGQEGLVLPEECTLLFTPLPLWPPPAMPEKDFRAFTADAKICDSKTCKRDGPHYLGEYGCELSGIYVYGYGPRIKEKKS